VEAAQFQLRLFHQARAGEAQELSVRESAPGVYWASATLERAGQWRFIGQARRNEQLYLIDRTEQF
jgi:hypothetical protein